MASIAHYYDSLDSATVTVNSLGTNSSYPVNNLYDRSKNLYWKAANSNTAGSLDIDLGSARACTSLVLGNHNISAGIKLAYDDNDNGAYSSVSYVVGSSGAYHAYVSGNVTNWVETFSNATKRYWRLYLQAMGGGTYQQIATIFLGATLTHTVNWSYGGELGSTWGIQTGETTGGMRRRQKNFDERRSWKFTYEWISDTHHTNIMTFLRAVYGNYYPFFFSDEAGNLYYVALTTNLQARQNMQYQLYHYPITLEEEL